jgi:hypothetical protein
VAAAVPTSAGCLHCVLLCDAEEHPAPVETEEEGLHGVFKRLRRNGHQLEKGCYETAQLRLSLKWRLNPRKTAPV